MNDIISEKIPVIYAYKLYLPDRYSYIKIGYTEQNPQSMIFNETAWSKVNADIVLVRTAIKNNGRILTASEFHEYLKQLGYRELRSGIDHFGWFRCEPKDIIAAYKHLIGNP